MSTTGASGRRLHQGCDVVFTFSCETWADACRRQMYMPADRLLGALMERSEVRRLLVANPFRSLPISTARRLLGQRQPPFTARRAEQVLTTPLRLRRRDPAGVPGVERAYAAYDRRLEESARGMGMERPAVITGNPFVAAFCALEWAGPVTFYAWDDWAAYPPHRRWWGAYEAAYRRIAELGRRVCAVSGVLLERLAPTGPSVVVPNGIDVAEWQRPLHPPAWFAALPGPRVLYVGTLDERLDTDAVAQVAESIRPGVVVLVGQVTNPAALAPLRRLDNVTIHPPVGRDGVTGLVACADVCVMPHRRTALTEAMSPLKLYEYLAGGRPVVSADLPPARGIDPRVVLVRDGDSFAAGVRRALELGPATPEQRRSFLDANDWARRHDAILGLALA